MPAYDTDLSFARAQSLIGGATGSIPYQTANSATAFIPIGANATVLTSNGTTATWAAPSGIVAGSASQVQTTRLTTNATHFITFVDSDNASATAENVYTTATLVVNPNTQFVGIGTGSPTATLTVGGGARISGLTTVTNSTNATSTATGALLVDGGVGINRDVYIGGNEFVLGDLEVRGGDFIVNGTTTFNLADTTATTVNFARAATALTMGALTGSTTVRNNLVITGNLTVNGATTIVDSTVTNVSDPIFIIGSGPSGANPTADDNKDRGIQFKWHNGTSAKDGFFGYDDSTGFFTFVPDATITNEVVSGTKGALDANLAGGTAMSIHYQSAANATAFLAAGSAGQILQTNGTGSAPTWVNANTVSGGTATQVANALTFSNAGSGDASGTTYNGSAARTISYNSIGAPEAGQISTSTVKLNNGIVSRDNRSVDEAPGFRAAGLYVDFKSNATNSLSDGGTYNGVLTFRSYGSSNSDFSGGQAQQIAYTDNNNLWHRISTNSSTWGTWYKILDTLNSSTAHVNLANNVLTVGQASNANYFLTFVDTNNAAATTEAFYTTSSFVINPTVGVGINTNPVSGVAFRVQGTGNNDAGFEVQRTAADNIALLSYNRSGAAYTKFANYALSYTFFAGSAGTTRAIEILSGGEVAISTSTNQQQMGLTVNTSTYIRGLGVGTTASGTLGEIRATNEITAYFSSDARLKENVRLIEDPITMIDQIRGVRFDWKDEYINDRGGEDGYFVRKNDIGVIAQEIEAVLPEIVATRDNGYKAVKYEKIVALLIEAVKEQQRQINQILQRLDNSPSK